ncbi:hypothetical protein LXA43DRAFT_285676 [Ganoderma leucocontextum]|nr:hypothetical protein LXA43DRAFT_285676 [Ganoderma leucocontextum]
MASYQVTAWSRHISENVITTSIHQYPTLAQAVNDAPPLFFDLQCDSLTPYDFVIQDSHLQRLLSGQHHLENLTLQMAPLCTQDRVHTIDITSWELVALRTLRVYGFIPRGLDKFPNGTGNEFSNLTSLTLGSVGGLYPPITVQSFFKAVATWRSLEELDIQHYSQLMDNPAALPENFARLPALLKLSLTDEPAWISRFLTYTDKPSLCCLHLRTAFTVGPLNAAAMLTSWRPESQVLQEEPFLPTLQGISKVVVAMAEDEHQPTRIVGSNPQGIPFLTLEAEARKPPGMDDAAWRSRYASWARSSSGLGQIISSLASLFTSRENVSCVDVSGDFDGVLAGHWREFFESHPALSELRIHDRAGRDASELFRALAEVDRRTEDMLCPNLGVFSVEDARYSTAFLEVVSDTLKIRREAELAHLQLNLKGSCDEYARDFPEGNPMDNTPLAAARRSVGSFNLQILDWQGHAIYSYGG